MRDIVTGVLQAEIEACRQHAARTCHLSEWSCSFCEDDGCSHDWLLRPESDTYVCLICGAER